LTATDNGAFGVTLSGHATRLADSEIRGTRGEDSNALVVLQTDRAPVERSGSHTVALSQLRETTLAANEGNGLLVGRVALACQGGAGPEDADHFCDAPPAAGATLWEAVRLQSPLDVTGLRVEGGRTGALLMDSAVSLSGARLRDTRGIGIWSAGSFARLVDNEVDTVGVARLVGRDGAFEAAYGLVLQGSKYFGDLLDGRVEATGNRIAGAERAGLLLVRDRQAFGGRVRALEAEIEPGLPVRVGVVGALDGGASPLDYDPAGIPPQVVDPQDVPPPACDGLCSE
jgi:hypothetical protein